ncbi:unnamed protein product, partial [marine sediment metagenome]
PALIAVLKDESINYKAAIVLGDLGDRRAAQPLKDMLTHPNPDRRLWAGYGLAKLGDPVGVPTVAEFLKDPQWVQRRHAARALGEVGDKRAVPALIDALKDKNANVRVSAARSLGKLGDPSAIGPLKALATDATVTTSGTPTAVRDAATEAIRQIQGSQSGGAEPAWGEAVEGVQVRVRADKTKWKIGETPSFKVDVRNRGTRHLGFQLARESWDIEINGVRYRATGIWTGGEHTTFGLNPGRKHEGISIPLDKKWAWQSVDGKVS